jgi:hypothetical protein
LVTEDCCRRVYSGDCHDWTRTSCFLFLMLLQKRDLIKMSTIFDQLKEISDVNQNLLPHSTSALPDFSDVFFYLLRFFCCYNFLWKTKFERDFS